MTVDAGASFRDTAMYPATRSAEYTHVDNPPSKGCRATKSTPSDTASSHPAAQLQTQSAGIQKVHIGFHSREEQLRARDEGARMLGAFKKASAQCMARRSPGRALDVGPPSMSLSSPAAQVAARC